MKSTQKIPLVRIGDISLGAENPVVIQSMTNTDTADIAATVSQILELHEAGAEMVRFTVNNAQAAKATPQIVEQVRKKTNKIGLVGDFHFNGHDLLHRFPDCAQSLEKYRINPGNAQDQFFRQMIEYAIKYDKPVRIGVNSGSIDSQILDQAIAKNAVKEVPETIEKVLENAVVESALHSAKLAEKYGLSNHKIVLSAKMSGVSSTIAVYEALAKSNYVLHLGLTEAGGGDYGVVSSTVALGTLLHQGIGHTIRISLTPAPHESRTKEVEVCKMLLQSLGLRKYRPQVISCPGCGRTSEVFFQHLAESVNKKIDQNLNFWIQKYPGVEHLKIAVMGCVVNGPGESRHADIGISLPGKMEKPVALVYREGQHVKDLQGDRMDEQFLSFLESYLEKRFGEGGV